MKTCGCILYYAFYPCGHQSSEWIYCPIAKAKNLLRRGPPKACDSHTPIEIAPDLEDTCGSTCLTQPYQCTNCGSPKQVGWRCSRCQCKRTKNAPVWEPCVCPNPNHNCPRFALRKRGQALCTPCRSGACISTSPTGPQLKSKPMPVLHWKCHMCSKNNSTPANNMRCGSPRGTDGCGHTRCGKCRALFSCTCGCGCAYTFVEGGPGVCNWCIRTCSKFQAT
ncbi:uncharacterized protein F4807DRAFT_385746 [Annulohypoxylon truncatum]|uniref:uncharacterized protein n=1 Tax=Annulohypoxylon truncatum TaxID=327061 RepID=UPI00200802A6|nr:uncharacterized protein F4807DRAFT_385746 [Annulohypoxylon truncatum]KAI1212027.1 hypothetical protein F4807DRAFT_385746 [Annulohypoxylon truncatum]